MMNKNVFVKPNGQSPRLRELCHGEKTTVENESFPIDPLPARRECRRSAGASRDGGGDRTAGAAASPRNDGATCRTAVEGELQELLERIPDSLRVDKWIPGTVVVDGHILEPVPLHKPEMERWSMPRQQQVTPIERDFVRRLTSGWLAVSNGQAFNWEYGRRIWGVGSIYPGSYLDARTLSFPLPR